jgi:LTXXQ motif family protein
MAIKGSIVAAIVSISVLLIPETQSALARGGGGHPGGGGHAGGGAAHFGGGHFGGGAAHFRSAGGGHFQGARMGGSQIGHAHVGTARVRGSKAIGASRAGPSRFGNAKTAGTAKTTGSARNARNLNNARLGPARANTAHAFATGAKGAFAGKAAWNQWGNPNWKSGWSGWNGGWGGWYGGWGGWVGPVFWPYFFGNLLAFTFWPYPYFDPFWAYGDWFVWDAVFWPGPYYGPAYAYGPGYDVYGGYAYGGHARHIARRAAPDVTGSIPNQTDLAQSCSGLAPGVTDLPMDRIETALRLTNEQLRALDDLKAASSQARDALSASCSGEIPLTPVDRLDAVQKRIDSTAQALAIVRAPLDNFYNSLNDRQRERFATLGPARSERTGRRDSNSGNDLADLCSRRAENFTQLPAQRIEQAIKPTQQQLDVFDKLKVASAQAANQLQASCPAQLPQTPLDRFDAVSNRLNAMSRAIKTVRPALADFYASLSDEQKARFNTLGPPNTSRQGQL